MQYAACASHVTGDSYNYNIVDLVILIFTTIHLCYILTAIDIHDLSNQESLYLLMSPTYTQMPYLLA